MKILNRLIEFDKFSGEIHKECLNRPHKYLLLLGVDPEYQGQGYAKELLLPFLDELDQKKLPCYLETHNPANIPFYQKYGFSVKAKRKVPGTEITHWAMVRE